MARNRKKWRRSRAPSINARSICARAVPARARPRSLRLEALEEKHLLAVFSVSNLDDAAVAAAGDAPGTLRQAIFDANAAPGADEIVFSDRLSGTILLAEGEVEITESATIRGPGAGQLTLEAFDPTPDENNGDGNRIFRIDDGTGTIHDVAISGLTLTGGDVDTGGGAIFSLENLSVQRSHITGNSASSTSGFLTAGGGIYINNATLVVEASTISDNFAYHDNGAVGGGIASGQGDVTIRSSTVTGNTARAPLGLSGGVAYGGGVAVGNGTHTFAHSTIFDNRVSGMDSFGGGVFAFGTEHATNVDHTIVAENFGEFGREISSDLVTPRVTLAHSLIGHNTGFAFNDNGGNLLDENPLLINKLLNRGGPTPTLGIRPSSPVIDQGNPAAQAGVGSVPAFDQRGAPFHRIADGDGNSSAIIDIGATEYQAVAGLTLVVDTLLDENDGDYTAGDLSLREAIGLANGSIGSDAITFDAQLSGQTILLTKGDLSIVEGLTVDALSSVGALVIDASASDPTPDVKQGDGSRIFAIDADFRDDNDVIDVVLSGLHLTGGDVDGNGGAIDSEDNLELVEVTIDGNFATGNGGGVDVSNSDATLLVTGSTISRNIAGIGSGGGIQPHGFSTRGGGGIRLRSADATILNSTISGNRTVGDAADGGGIVVTSAKLTIRHSTITGNSTSGTGSHGGNIFFRYSAGSDELTLDHVIVANGSSETDNDIHSPDDPILATSSLIEDSTGLTINGSGNVTGADPNLGPLVENGGRTRTHALLPGSAAIDAGAFTFTGPPDFDQRGDSFVRVANGNGDAFTIIDIGAYERQTVAGLNLVVDAELDENDGNYGPGDLSLREAIGLANGSIGNDVITFASNMVGKTIVLTLGELQVVDDVVIDATSLGGRITIDASGNDPTADAPPTGDGTRVLTIDDGNDANFIEVELIGLTLTGGDVIGNGGAISSRESLMFVNGTIFENAAISLIPSGSGNVGAGGAIQVQGGGSLVLENATIYKNSGDVGGGIAVNDGNATLSNSTISGNVASSDGAGLWAAGLGTAITAHHSTIAANLASDEGGGVMVAAAGGSITLDHTIVADNFATTARDVSSVDAVVFDHGWVENASGFTPTGGLQFIGSDPRLTPLADHGGATLTHALDAGSPAIDVGNLFFTPPPNSDQRGDPFVRVFDGDGDATPRIDIGAYERQVVPGLVLTVDTASDLVNGNFTAGDLSLREAVSLANGSIGADNISFAPALSGNTIVLLQGQLTITENVAVDAMALAENIVVDASGSDSTPGQNLGDGSRLFFVSDNDLGTALTVYLAGLELTGGDVDGAGGAIFSLEHLEINESTIRNNAAFNGNGGGVLVNDRTLIVSGSTISNNHANSGGGIALRTGDLTLINSTVSSNNASVRGGGIYGASGGVLDIRHSTLSDNLADSDAGGGIHASSNVALTVNHTIVANNQADGAPDISAVETASMTYSLVEDASGFAFVGSPNITGQDPDLGPLADNGGPTSTHALLDGSAAIDAGEFGIASPPDFDQRGAPFARIVANLGAFEVIDIGAFEAQASGADFDQDGDKDGRDFLLWQRGFPTFAGAEKSDGDADNDGDVDADDLAAWEAQYGELLPPAAAAAQSSPAIAPQYSIPSANAIDAALAMEWINHEVEPHQSLTFDEGDQQSVLLRWSIVDDGPITPTPSEYAVPELNAPASEPEDVQEAGNAWLSDELVEDVFG